MFTTCIFCNVRFGRNTVIEHFPVGRRLAFDAAKGRLWVVCADCRRWNLAPIEERWEAIEECERRFRATRARVSTDNIGLAPLPEGLELIRVGPALRPEFAAWRYGSQLLGRYRRLGVAAGIGAAAAAVTAPFVAGAVMPVLVPMVFALGMTAPIWVAPSLFAADAANALHPDLKDRLQWEKVVLTIQSPRGRLLDVRVRHLWESAYTTEGGELMLRLSHDGGTTTLTGADALATGARLLARANWLGGRGGLVRHAVAQIEAAGDAERYLMAAARRVARFGGRRRMLAQRRHIGALGLEPVERLALEMAVHEESERRAIEEELGRLSEEWRSAEEIAEIADSLLIEPEFERLQKRVE